MAMDETISAAEANRDFSRLVRGVREGHSYTVTSDGRPVARIVPIEPDLAAREEAKRKLLERLRNQSPRQAGPWTRDDLYDD
jgi:prevent-host-death family protein